MLTLAVVITPLHLLQTIQFKDCHFPEFGNFCVATARRPLTLRFVHCSFNIFAAEALQFMLECNSKLEELSFTDCYFDEDQAARAIEVGLSKNRTLRKFQFIFSSGCEGHSYPSPINGVQGMLNSSEKIVTLNLTVTDESFWDMFRAAHDNKTLESLSFYKTQIEYHCIEAILCKCFMLKSLKELGFHKCTFQHKTVVDLLVKAVSENKILECLSVQDVYVGEDVEDLEYLSCGGLQVSTLRLKGFCFSDELANMLDDVASNPNIKCLDLQHNGRGVIDSEGVEKLCHALLLPNCGLLELLIDGAHDVIDELSGAFQQNVSVKSLTIGGLKGTSLISFAQALANMSGLRKVSFKFLSEKDEYIEEFFQRLEATMEQTSTIQTLALVDFDPNHEIANKYLTKIRYYLAINQVCRDSLMREPLVPAGVWAHVLGKTLNEAAGINFILRSKPDIVVAAWSRNARKGTQQVLRRQRSDTVQGHQSP